MGRCPPSARRSCSRSRRRGAAPGPCGPGVVHVAPEHVRLAGAEGAVVRADERARRIGRRGVRHLVDPVVQAPDRAGAAAPPRHARSRPLLQPVVDERRIRVDRELSRLQALMGHASTDTTSGLRSPWPRRSRACRRHLRGRAQRARRGRSTATWRPNARSTPWPRSLPSSVLPRRTARAALRVAGADGVVAAGAVAIRVEAIGIPPALDRGDAGVLRAIA